MSLSIVIVNYCSEEDILNCLESAFRFPSAGSFEWIVVDNDADTRARDMVLARFPFVRWIKMNYNAGFSRANNRGIAEASGDAILLLNPDTLVVDDAIAKCYDRLMHSAAIAASPQLIFPDHTLQIAGNYFMKGGLNHLLPLPYWGKLLKFIADIFKVKKPNVLEASAEQKVDWINGAFLMVKRKAIEAAGLLDEDFFLYAEEAEWCYRLGKTGDLFIFGDMKMIHIQGESVSRATSNAEKGYVNLYDKKGLQLMLSNHVRIRKQFGVGWFLFQLINFTFAIPIFAICSFFENLVTGKNPFKRWAEVKGLAKNTFAIWKLSPVIIANKPYFYKVL